MTLRRLLTVLAEACRRRAGRVVLGGLVLALLAGTLAATRLGVSTDTDALFDATLPWRQREIANAAAFPQFNNLLVAVVEGATPEEAEATAAALAATLSADTAHFTFARQPDANPWFARNALLFLDEPDLAALLDSTIDAQPFLGQLASDPSARGLFATLALVAMGVDRGEKLDGFRPALAGFAEALTAAAAGAPTPLSWQRLLAGKLVEMAGPRRLVLAQARLDLGALEPGGAATTALRTAAAAIPAVRDGRATIRLTGPVALADEEFATVAQGVEIGMAASSVLVLLWLALAVRSWRLILAIVATLILGLTVTTGFAALAVGTLNLISVAFAVLFVGLAVDFAIQFCVRYREQRLATGDAALALPYTVVAVGPQIVLAALATAAGFLAFVPTSFRGVAELGLIAGVGMLVALASTLTFLPACLTLLRPRGEPVEVGYAWAARAESALLRIRWPVVAAFATLCLAGAALLPRLTFDSDPLHTKNPNTEAMTTLRALMDDPLTSPYTADIIAPSAAAADALLPRLRALPLAAEVVTLSSLVPADQPAKLPLIADAASILAATLAPRAAAAPVTAADLRLAVQTAHTEIARVLTKLPPDDPLRAIAAALATLATAPDALLLATNAALTRFLPDQLDRLRLALRAGPVTLADLPDSLARDWRLPDGRVRVLVSARPAAHDANGLHAFVDQLRDVAPQAGGSAVTIVETAATIVGAFRSAALFALAAIALLLLAVLRRLADVALVMGALLASALLTVVVAVLLPLPLNFANIVALPLLLGVGVSYNIYFVMNRRAGATRFLGTATARAVLFSALTTATAFGALAASGHPGTASMGALLLWSLGATLLVTLVLLPVVLAWNRGAWKRGGGRAAVLAVLLAIGLPHPSHAAEWTDWRAIMWQDRSTEGYRALRALGITAGRVLASRDDPYDTEAVARRMAPLLDAGARWYVENIATDFYASYHRWRPDHPSVTWLFDETKRRYRENPADPTVNFRQPSLSDPVWHARIAARLRATVAQHAPHRPLFYNLADEAGIADLAAAWDFDFSPESLADFRAWLRTQYRDIAALNRQWATSFPTWDTVLPPTTTAAMARADANWSGWADFKAWMDVAFATALRAGTDALHRADPAALSGIAGAQLPGWGGYDYGHLVSALDVIEAYDAGYNVEIARSLNPGLVLLTTSFAAGPAEAGRLWRQALLGGRGAIIWDEGDFLRPDNTPAPRALSLAPTIRELAGGIGAQLIASRPHHDAVAILYSQSSFRTQWMLAHRHLGARWTERGSEDEWNFAPPHRLARARAARLLSALGAQPRWLTTQMLEAGALRPAGQGRAAAPRLLVLPETVALSNAEAAEIRGFAARGGIVLQLGEAGLYDGHSRRLARPQLASLAPAGAISHLPADDAAALPALAALLARARATPALRVATAAGSDPAELETRVLRNGRVLLAGLQRRAEVQAEGTTDIVLTLPPGQVAYDLRRGARLPAGTALALRLTGAEPVLLALAPAALPPPTLAAPAAARLGTSASLRLGLAGHSPAAATVLRLVVTGPDGTQRPTLSGRAVLHNGRAAWTLLLPPGEAAGSWQVTATDVLSGASAQLDLRVTP